MIRIIIKG